MTFGDLEKMQNGTAQPELPADIPASAGENPANAAAAPMGDTATKKKAGRPKKAKGSE